MAVASSYVYTLSLHDALPILFRPFAASCLFGLSPHDRFHFRNFLLGNWSNFVSALPRSERNSDRSLPLSPAPPPPHVGGYWSRPRITSASTRIFRASVCSSHPLGLSLPPQPLLVPLPASATP